MDGARVRSIRPAKGGGRLATDRWWPPSSRAHGPREPLETLWRMQAPTGIVWECIWYRTALGFELRVEHASDDHDIVAVKAFSTLCNEMEDCSAEWKNIALARGFRTIRL